MFQSSLQLKLGYYLIHSSGGLKPKWKTRPVGEACLVLTMSSKAKKLKFNHLDVMYERGDEVEDSRRTRIPTRFTAVV